MELNIPLPINPNGRMEGRYNGSLSSSSISQGTYLINSNANLETHGRILVSVYLEAAAGASIHPIPPQEPSSELAKPFLTSCVIVP